MRSDAAIRLGRAALPIVAVLSLLLGVGLTLAAAGDTLGFDFLAYHQAAARVLDGQPLYDMSYTETGGFGLFYYPPTFAPLVLAFGALGATIATWAWIDEAAGTMRARAFWKQSSRSQSKANLKLSSRCPPVRSHTLPSRDHHRPPAGPSETATNAAL
ncbi:MAG: hypothetical protein ACAH65_07065, partial [Chloroflexota bacterium]